MAERNQSREGILKAASATVLWQVATVLLGLIFIGVYSRAWLPEEFAIFLLAQGLVAISALLDVGLTRSLLYYQSKYGAGSNHRLGLVYGAQGLSIVIALSAIVIGVLLGLVLEVFFGLTEMYSALYVTILACLPFVLFTLVHTTVVEAAGRFSTIARFRFFSAFLTYALPLCAYQLAVGGDSFKYIFGGLFLAKVITAFTAWKLARVPVIFNPIRNWRESRLLFQYGQWVGLSNLMGIGFAQGDRVILTAATNLTTLASYIPFADLIQKTSMLSNSLLRIVFVISLRSTKSVRKRLEKHTFLLIISLFVPFGIVILNAEWIVTVWLGHSSFSTAIVVFQILLTSLWVKLFAQFYVNKLYEENRADLVTLNHVIEIGPYLGLVVIGAIGFAEVGVAAVVLLREISDALLLRFQLAKVRRVSTTPSLS